MKIRLVLQLELADLEGVPVESRARYEEVCKELPEQIRERLFGDGFLPDDLTTDAYDINSEIVG